MSSMLDTAFGLLDTVPTVVKAVSGGILVVSALAYFAWFRRKAAKLLITLHQVQGALAKPDGAWPDVQERVLAAARGHAGVLSAWLETKSRVLSLSIGQGTSPSQVMFGAPRDLWAGNRLMARGFNLPLADAIPNQWWASASCSPFCS